MEKKIKTIKQLITFANNFDGGDGEWESEFNQVLIEMLIKGTLDKEVYLEYLEITQTDILECLENC